MKVSNRGEYLLSCETGSRHEFLFGCAYYDCKIKINFPGTAFGEKQLDRAVNPKDLNEVFPSR